jgi:hypothetical protein
MFRTLFLGVDPGKKGAIAFLDPVSMDLEVHDMPLSKTTTGKEEIDLRSLALVVSPYRDFTQLIAVIEKVASMPSDGHAGAFTFGQGYGALRMGIILHGYEDRYVTPVVWKRHFKLSKDKGVSRSYAQTRFPRFAELFNRVKDDGRAEAALIALYGAEIFFRSSNLTP